MAWTEEDLAIELADLFELDSGRSQEGWVVWTTPAYGRDEFALQLGDATFVVTVEKVR